MTKIGGCNDLGPGVYCCECGDEITDALAHDCPVLGEHHHDHDPHQPAGYDEDAEHSILYEGAQPAPSMMQQVRDRLDRLTCLPPDWNGYKESPISEAAADEARRVAEKIISLGPHRPSSLLLRMAGCSWNGHSETSTSKSKSHLSLSSSTPLGIGTKTMLCSAARKDQTPDRCHKMLTDLAGVRNQARSLGTRR